VANILVVDDDKNHCKVLKGILERIGLQSLVAYSADTAMPIIEKKDLDLIITDLKMPGKSGMDLLILSQERKPSVPVILMTGYGTIEAAIEALKKGAYDFITKPFDEIELMNVIKKALLESRKNKELVSAYFDKEQYFLPDIIGSTPAMQHIFKTVHKIAPTDSTVLVTGETGVGKELIAKAIHSSSKRRDNMFVKVNCSAIPETLLESELFGYERGAFTGAITSKPGRFEIANKGTVFIDEIGEIPLHLQTKLLNVLQDRAFERLGGVKTIRVDIRIIAATNIDLQAAVRSGKFRSDLFYRFNVVPIQIPPLRERKDDLMPLIQYLLNKFTGKYNKKKRDISPEALAVFMNYNWPGNIRELENALERMVVMSENDTLDIDQVPLEIKGEVTSREPSTFKEKMNSVSRITEKKMIIDALNKTNQNRTKAAHLLGISRRTLQNKIKEYGL
jgi:two-component system response regulator AtoC